MPQNRSRLTMLAGWLFADLFLVLLIAGLAALPARTSANPVKPPGSPSPAPSPSATHSPGLDPRYLDFSISLSPDAFRTGTHDQLVQDVNRELSHLDPAHRPVGFVLVFASDDPNDAGRAVRTATDAFNLLHNQSPDFAEAAGLGYWGGGGNDFVFKVFLLN
jgi:hypothetical protein